MGELAQQYAKNSVESRAGFLAEAHHAMTFNQRAAVLGRTDLYAYRPAGNGLSDVTIVDAHKIVAEAQIKHLASSADTRRALNDARYDGMQRVGPGDQQLGPHAQSTVAHDGVQSRATSNDEIRRLATQDADQIRRTQQLRSTIKALGLCAATGAALHAAPVARDCYRRWKMGEMTGQEARNKIFKAGAKGAAQAVAMSVLANGLSTGLKAILKPHPDTTSMHGVTWNEWGSGAATFIVGVGMDAWRLSQHQINPSQFRWRCVRHTIHAGGQVGGQVASRLVATKVAAKAGPAIGKKIAEMAAKGATTGATVGSIAPGVGNAMGIFIGAIAGIAVAMIIGATADIVATTVAPDSKTGHGQEREAAPPLVKKHLLIAIREDALQVLMAASKIDALWHTIPEENKEVATTLGARKYWEEQLSRVERERHPHPEASELRAEIKWLQEVLKALQQKHEECLAFLHDLQLELTYQPQNFFSKSSRSNYS